MFGGSVEEQFSSGRIVGMKPVLKTKREISEVLVRTGSRAVRTESAESCLQVFGAILKLLKF